MPESAPGGGLLRGVPGLVRGGGVCLVLGGLLLGRGCLVWGCLVLGGGGGIPACTEADPPVNRMTNRCKNITLATTSLWPVTRMHSSRMRTVCNSSRLLGGGSVCLGDVSQHALGQTPPMNRMTDRQV